MTDCSVVDCTKRAHARGWCPMHLTRYKRHGTVADPRPSEAQRFWSKVDRNGLPAVSWDGTPLPGVCWLWRGAGTDLGHGLFFPRRREPIGAHRYSYQAIVGSIGDGLVIDHLCRNPRCVNPDHLEPVTTAVNTLRGNYARKAAV